MCSRSQRSRIAAIAFGVGLIAMSGRARAQACCAGASALTPGRLSMHEDALVGGQVRAAGSLGSWNDRGAYHASPSGSSELDFEQDVFGALRFAKHAQAALFVPLVETHRRTGGESEFGGGLGDVNLSARYDFVDAGKYRILPGIAALAGVTFPTGRAPEDTSRPLATDATGIGAFQGNVGLALEQTFGHWFVNVTALAAKRLPRSVHGVDSALATRFTFLAGGGYVRDDDAALAMLVSYALEGDATVNDVVAKNSSRRTTTITISGTLPLSDRVRLTGGVFWNLPLSSFGTNEPASLGLAFGVLRTWS